MLHKVNLFFVTDVTQATETMTWDKESRMLTNSLANASYVYNGFDARVSKTVASTTTTFKRAGADPVSPVVSDVVGGSTTTNYLPGISSRTGGTSTFSHSGIKNGLLQTNSSQSNTATKRYDAFGNEFTPSGTWQTRFDYGGAFGYQRDDESGYKLLGHRYYDPEIGRFLTRDPSQDGRNWYAYSSNSPTSRADAGGLKDVLIIIGSGIDDATRDEPRINARYVRLANHYIEYFGRKLINVKLLETPTLSELESALKSVSGVVFIGHGGENGARLRGSGPKLNKTNTDVLTPQWLNKHRPKGKKLDFLILETCNARKDPNVRKLWLQSARTVSGYTQNTFSDLRNRSIEGNGKPWSPKMWGQNGLIKW